MLQKKSFFNSFFSFCLGFKLSGTVPERPEPASEFYGHTKEPERDTTVRVIVDVNSSVKPVRVWHKLICTFWIFALIENIRIAEQKMYFKDIFFLRISSLYAQAV